MTEYPPKVLTPAQVRVVKKLLSGRHLIYDNKYGRKPWAITHPEGDEYLPTVCALALIRRGIICKTSELGDISTWGLTHNWRERTGIVRVNKWIKEYNRPDDHTRYACGIAKKEWHGCCEKKCRHRFLCPAYNGPGLDFD